MNLRKHKKIKLVVFDIYKLKPGDKVQLRSKEWCEINCTTYLDEYNTKTYAITKLSGLELLAGMQNFSKIYIIKSISHGCVTFIESGYGYPLWFIDKAIT